MAHELLLLADSRPAQEREQAILAAAAKVNPSASVRIHRFASATLGVLECGPEGDAVVEKDHKDRFELVLATSMQGAGAVLDGGRPSREFGSEAAHIRIEVSKNGATASIANDGLGLIRMFWAAPRSGELAAATSLSLLNRVLPRTEINEAAAAEYLLAEQIYGAKTLFRGVARLEPGSLLEWSDKGVSVAAHPLLDYRSDYSALGEDVGEWAKAFVEVWQAVLSDLCARASGRIIVGLSAGLDSRTIAGGLRSISQPFFAFTYGSALSAEVRVAADVSAALAIPHMLVPYGPETIMPSPDRCHATIDDGTSAVSATECWFSDVLTSLGRTFLTGYGGDAIWGNDRLWGVSEIAEIRQLLVRRLARGIGKVHSFVDPDLANQFVPVIHRTVEESTEGLSASGRPDTGLMWLLRNRVVGWGWNFVNIIRRMGLQYENPFYTSPMLKYALSMPPAVRAHGRAYLRVHRDYFPATAHIARNIDGAIPASDTNYLYFGSFARVRRQAVALTFSNPRYAARRLGSIALNRVASRLSGAGYPRLADTRVEARTPFSHDSAARRIPIYRERLARLVEQTRDLDCPLLSRSALTGALDGLNRGEVPASPITLGRLAALAAWTAPRH